MEEQNVQKEKNQASGGGNRRRGHRGGRGHGHKNPQQQEKSTQAAPEKENKQPQNPPRQDKAPAGGEKAQSGGGNRRRGHRGGRGKGRDQSTEAALQNAPASKELKQDFFVSPTINRASTTSSLGGDRVLMGIRLENVKIDNHSVKECIIAFDDSGSSFCGYDALVPSAILGG
jgi:hypothetical protein